MHRVRTPAMVGIATLIACLAPGPVIAQEEAQPKGSALARAAQQELYRLGCYSEAINGVWTSPSRSAAEKFLARVNARLPVEQPDEALLALLRNTRGFVCDQCPLGEAFNSAGDCVPKALVDKVAKSAPITTGAVAEPPRSVERSASDEPASEHDAAGPGKPAGPASGVAKYWRSFLRTIDRALGAE